MRSALNLERRIEHEGHLSAIPSNELPPQHPMVVSNGISSAWNWRDTGANGEGTSLILRARLYIFMILLTLASLSRFGLLEALFLYGSEGGRVDKHWLCRKGSTNVSCWQNYIG